MGLFDKLKQAAGQLADGASRQAEIFKLQGELGRAQEEVERNLVQVGQRTRELYKQRQVEDAQIKSLMQGIDELEDRMMELRAEVQKLQQAADQAPQPAATQYQAPAAPPAPPVAPVVQPSQPPPAQPATVPPGVQPYRPPEAPAVPGPPAAPAEATTDDAAAIAVAKCPSCEALVTDGARFCQECGAKLGD